MMRAFFKGLAIAVTFLVIGTVGCKTQGDYRRSIQQELKSLNIADGVSSQEAYVIAENYFERYRAKLGGGVVRVNDGGDTWDFPTMDARHLKFFKMAYTPEPIRVHKATGRVTWSDGPTIEDPLRLWD